MSRAVQDGPEPQKGVVGLATAWIQSAAGDKSVHQAMKFILSQASSKDARENGRAAFNKLAASSGGVYTAILEEEARLFGSNDEPAELACNPSW